MAICLETETIETFLQSLDLDKFITLFKENDIDLDLLMNLTETKLMGLLTDIKLTHGNRYKIAHKIENIKALDTKDQTKSNGTFGKQRCIVPSLDAMVQTDTQYSSKGSQFEVATKDANVQTDPKCLSKSSQFEGATKDTIHHTEVLYGSPQWEMSNKVVPEKTDCSKNETRTVLIGKTGSGKSATDSNDEDETDYPYHGSLQWNVASEDSNDDDETDYPYHGSPQWNVVSEDLGPRRLQRSDNIRNEIRIALIGKTGSGKSATGNTILNNKTLFKSLFSYISITKKCSQGFIYRFGKKIVVVDTPGIFDTDLSNDDTQQEISKCIGITSPGPHAFILVLSLSSRFTDEEQKTVDHFVKWFGDTVYEYFIVLFTKKDELDKHNMTLEQHLTQVPAALQTFIDKCGRRVLAFNNELTDKQSDQQVKKLVDMIEQNVKRNGGNCYTNEAYIKAEIEVKRMEEENFKKAREEAEERLRKFRESKTKKEVEAEEEVVRKKLHEKEKNIRDETRKEIAQKGFFQRSVDIIRSLLPFKKKGIKFVS